MYKDETVSNHSWLLLIYKFFITFRLANFYRSIVKNSSSGVSFHIVNKYTQSIVPAELHAFEVLHVLCVITQTFSCS